MDTPHLLLLVGNRPHQLVTALVCKSKRAFLNSGARCCGGLVAQSHTLQVLAHMLPVIRQCRLLQLLALANELCASVVVSFVIKEPSSDVSSIPGY